MDKSGLLPIPEGERVPVTDPIPKIWMDAFDTIAANMQLDRPTFILQLISRMAQTIATRVGGETAPLSKEETEGGLSVDLDRRGPRARDSGSPGFPQRKSGPR